MSIFIYICICSVSVFNIAGIDLDKPIISSCQIGYAATIMAGTLHMLGVDVPVYYVRIGIKHMVINLCGPSSPPPTCGPSSWPADAFAVSAYSLF